MLGSASRAALVRGRGGFVGTAGVVLATGVFAATAVAGCAQRVTVARFGIDGGAIPEDSGSLDASVVDAVPNDQVSVDSPSANDGLPADTAFRDAPGAFRGDLCSNPLTISSGVPTGSTIDAYAHDIVLSCVMSEFGDVFYAFSLAVASNVVVNAEFTGPPITDIWPALAILSGGCSAPVERGCASIFVHGLTVPALPAGEYLLAVKGWPFEYQVTLTTTPI